MGMLFIYLCRRPSRLSSSSLAVLFSRQWARDAVSCLSSRLFALTVLMPLRKAGRLRCALGGVFLLLWYLGDTRGGGARGRWWTHPSWFEGAAEQPSLATTSKDTATEGYQE
jgi:hypothetical protein